MYTIYTRDLYTNNITQYAYKTFNLYSIKRDLSPKD